MGTLIVHLGWRFVVGTLVAVGLLLAAALFYQGILAALSFRWLTSIVPILVSVALGVGVFMICRHRGDLICD